MPIWLIVLLIIAAAYCAIGGLGLAKYLGDPKLTGERSVGEAIAGFFLSAPAYVAIIVISLFVPTPRPAGDQMKLPPHWKPLTEEQLLERKLRLRPTK